MILDSLQVVISIFLIIGTGYMLAALKVITPAVGDAISKIVMIAALPCTIVYHFQVQITRQQLTDLGTLLFISFLAIALSIVVAVLWAKAARIPAGRRGLFTVLFAFSNSAYMGFPVISSIYGQEAMPYALVFFAASVILTNIVAFIFIRGDGDRIRGEAGKTTIGSVLKRLATPVVGGIVVALLLLVLDIRIPDCLLTATKYIGDLSSPLALIFIGYMIHSIGFKNMKYEKGIAGVMLGRFLITPAIIFGLGMLFGLGGMPMKAVALQMALSCLVQPVVMTQMYGADTVFATKMVVYSTLASILTIPATVAVLNIIL